MVEGHDAGAANREILQLRAQERAYIKSFILSHIFVETNDKVGDFLSECLSIIVKTDSDDETRKSIQTIFATLMNALSEASANTNASPSNVTIPPNPFLQISRGVCALEAIFCTLSHRPIHARASHDTAINYLSAIYDVWTYLATIFITSIKSLLNNQNSNELFQYTLSLGKAVKYSTDTLGHAISIAPATICKSNHGQTIFPKLAEAISELGNAFNALPITPKTASLRLIISQIRGCASNAVYTAREKAPLDFKHYLVPFLTLFSDIIAKRATHRSSKLHEMSSYAPQGRDALRNYCHEQYNNEEGEGANKGNDRAAILAMNFITRVLTCQQYVETAGSGAKSIQFSSGGGIAFDLNSSTEISSMLQSYFTESYLENMIQMLVIGFMPWTSSELVRWEEDSEQFFHDLYQSSSDVDERASATLLFDSIASRRPGFVSRHFKKLLQTSYDAEKIPEIGTCGLSNILHDPNPSNLNRNLIPNATYFSDALTRDAIYLALSTIVFSFSHTPETDLKPMEYLGIKSNSLFEVIQSEQFKQLNLHSNLNIDGFLLPTLAFYRLNAVAASITDCTSLSGIEQNISLAVRSLSIPDTVVRFCATVTLATYVDSSNFVDVIPQFVAPQPNGLSFLQTCVKTLIQLSFDSHHNYSRVLAISTIAKIVSQVSGEHIVSLVPLLVESLQSFWQNSVDDSGTRQAIIDALTSLVGSLAGHSQSLHSVLFHVIEFSTNPNADSSVAYLFERGMELWHKTMLYTTSMTEPVLNNFRRWVEIYSICEDNVQEGISILQSYALLGGDAFLQRYAQDLSKIVPRLFKYANDDMMIIISSVIERLAQLYPRHFIDIFRECAEFIIEKLHDLNLHGEYADGAYRKSTYSTFFAILSHLFVLEPEYTCKTLQSIAAGPNATKSALEMILDCWLLYSNFVYLLFDQKRSAMSMFNIIIFFFQNSVTIPPAKMTRLLQFVHEIIQEEKQGDQHTLTDLSNVAEVLKTEAYRVELLSQSDPSETVDMHKYAMAKLHEIAALTSNDFIRECIAQVPDAQRRYFV